MDKPDRNHSKLKKIWIKKKPVFGISLISLVFLVPFVLLCDNLYAQNNTHIDTLYTSENTLTFATFNIHQFWDEQDILPNLHNLSNLIKSETIDIIGLQEMWQGNVRYLAQELNMSYFTTSDTQDDTFHGLSLLSKFPILDTHTFVFDSASTNFLRAMIWATISYKNDNITVYITHLDTPASYFSQLQQARNILDTVNSVSPTVLLCDCNAPDTVFLESYRLLTEHFEDGWVASGKRTFEGRTWPSDNPFLRVDYVWLSKNTWIVQENSGKTFGNNSYSDHLGLKVSVSKK